MTVGHRCALAFVMKCVEDIVFDMISAVRSKNFTPYGDKVFLSAVTDGDLAAAYRS
jgi:hypothetical protein